LNTCETPSTRQQCSQLASQSYVEASERVDDDAAWAALIDQVTTDWDAKAPPGDGSPYDLIATAFNFEDDAIKELRSIVPEIKRKGVGTVGNASRGILPETRSGTQHLLDVDVVAGTALKLATGHVAEDRGVRVRDEARQSRRRRRCRRVPRYRRRLWLHRAR
jgi:hypothetical protein